MSRRLARTRVRLPPPHGRGGRYRSLRCRHRPLASPLPAGAVQPTTTYSTAGEHAYSVPAGATDRLERDRGRRKRIDRSERHFSARSSGAGCRTEGHHPRAHGDHDLLRRGWQQHPVPQRWPWWWGRIGLRRRWWGLLGSAHMFGVGPGLHPYRQSGHRPASRRRRRWGGRRRGLGDYAGRSGWLLRCVG